jgi:polysaccharide biosynthesis/export protein
VRHERVKRARTIRGLTALALAGSAGMLTGCTETDSWLLDPSVMGRWEHTPTTVPILKRINAIEGPDDEWIQYTDPTPADLVPETSEYRMGPGDRVTITVYDIPDEGQRVPYDRIIDTRGIVDLPNIGAINLGGLTIKDAEDAVKEAMKPLVTNPLAAVEVLSRQTQRVSIVGAVQNTQQYIIPTADYKLYDALIAAGGFSEASEHIYVIRQVALSDLSTSKPKAGRPTDPMAPGTPPGETLNQIIDDLSTPQNPGGTPPGPAEPKPGASPGVMQPATPNSAQPPIDLIEPGAQPRTAEPTKPTEASQPDAGDSSWVFLNGRWVKVRKPGSGTPQAPEAIASQPAATTSPLVTQRIIRVPMARLAQGDARVNIVIRPGDVIRVPPPPQGNIFVSGQVARVGVYSMTDKLTLIRVLTAAGGLNQTAVPERIDLVRMVGNDRQAMIRLDGKAIAEGTNPDIYLKPNDIINVGTNFWQTPLAIIRNGFRFTYGFGFLADRNFGSDLFGVPPEARARNSF